MTESVFVLGPALDPAALHDHCVRTGHDASAVRPIGRAFLPDYAPVFARRDGGAAHLLATPRRGSALAGALFEVRDGGALFDEFDRTRGVGAARDVRTVLTENGRAHRVLVQADRFFREGDEVAAPSKEELESIIRGLIRFGHDASPLRGAALGRRVSTEPSSLFVYGTLRHGESRASCLDRHDPFEGGKGVVRGTVAGRLLDLGDYPAYVPTTERSPRVHGEVYTFGDLEEVFRDIDEIEDFHGYDAPGGEYVRALVKVDLDARERIAWTYVYAGDAAGHPIIASGDWTNRLAARPSIAAGA